MYIAEHGSIPVMLTDIGRYMSVAGPVLWAQEFALKVHLQTTSIIVGESAIRIQAFFKYGCFPFQIIEWFIRRPQVIGRLEI